MYHSQTVICAHLQPSELCRFLATGRPTPARESPTPLTQLLYDYMGTDQAIPVIRKLVVHLEQSKAVSKYVKVGLLRLLTQIIHKSQVPAALAWGWAGRNPASAVALYDAGSKEPKYCTEIHHPQSSRQSRNFGKLGKESTQQ